MSDLKLQVLDTQNNSIFNITESSGVNCITKLNILNTTDSISTTEGGSLTVFGGLGVSKTAKLNFVNSNIQTISNLLITGDLNVIGQTYVGTITTSNQIETNVTSTSIFVTNSLNSQMYNTIGNLYTNINGIGIFSTNPQHSLEIFSSGSIALGLDINDYKTISYSSGNLILGNILTINDSGIVTTDITSTNINFTGDLYKNGNIYISSQWITDSNNIFYTSGNVGINTTSPTSYLTISGGNSLNETSGSLVIFGGMGVTQDVRIAGQLYVGNEQITSNFTIYNQTIGSFTGTGKLQIDIPVVMPNSNYNIIGSLKTTSTVKNIYNVSFSDITSNQFSALIYRIDALGAGWTDPNLSLSYIIN